VPRRHPTFKSVAKIGGIRQSAVTRRRERRLNGKGSRSTGAQQRRSPANATPFSAF
jgi:ribosomal protein L15E